MQSAPAGPATAGGLDATAVTDFGQLAQSALDTNAVHDANKADLDLDAGGVFDLAIDLAGPAAADTELQPDQESQADVALQVDASPPSDAPQQADAPAGDSAAVSVDAAAPADSAPPTDTAELNDVAPPPDAASAPDAPPVACAPVAAPSPVAEAPLPALLPASAVQTVEAGGFTDDFLANATGDIKIGIRRQWGASIVFWGQNAANSNVIDANDTGREVQVAFYDPARVKQGCAWNASCLTSPSACANSITYLGWNPVQGGNECNLGSGVESVSHNAGLLDALVRPLFWNPDWQAQDCGNGGCQDPAKKALKGDVQYQQRIRFVHSHIAEIDMAVVNLSNVAHAATVQEMPTVYAAYGKYGLGNYNLLLASDGQAIAIDQPANDGFFVKNFSSAAGWVALQNAKKDYGVALYHENRLTAWQGWQKAGVFNNFRAQFSFGVPANGVVRARAYLMLGSFATLSGLAAWLDSSLPAFGHLDAPAPEAKVGGASLLVAGWALDNLQVAKVDAYLDGQLWQALPLSVPRPDVCQAWPGYAMCTGPVGFAQQVPLGGLTPCAHLLEIVATDSHGNARVLAKRRIFVGG